MKDTSSRFLVGKPGEEAIACLCLAASLLGRDEDFRDLRARYSGSSRASSLKEVAQIAAMIKMTTRSVQVRAREIGTLIPPAILSWANDELRVFQGPALGGGIWLFDPKAGRARVRKDLVDREFSGNALEVGLVGSAAEGVRKHRLRIPALLRLSRPLLKNVYQALALTACVQFYIILSPMFMRLIIDNVVVTDSIGLLNVATIGFSALCLFNGAASLLRTVAQNNINSLLSWDMGQRVFRHLIRLPLQWFQKKTLSDILSRLNSVDQVRGAFTSMLSAAFDGILVVVMLFVIFSISASVFSIAVASILLNSILRLIAVPFGQRLNRRSVLTTVSEQGKRIETLRAIQSIKALAGEQERESDWASRFAESLAGTRRYANFNATVSTSVSTALGLSVILATYLSGRQVIEGTLSLGSMTAIIAYLIQLNQSASNILQQVVFWRMLDVQMDRISEVMLEQMEHGIDDVVDERESELAGGIVLSDLGFRYGDSEPYLFQNVNLVVSPGDHIAIVGPSGSGKSTLLKLMVGLYRPSLGTVSIDGQLISKLKPRAIRRALGSVLQEDQLLLGSIADNVSFLADRIDMERVWNCLDAAAVGDEIRALPMSADTLVGDMGSNLSGGQKQRVLIARALYRQPQMLIMDEATSHLDAASEKAVIRSLAALGITRVVVAHRQETIAAADRVYRLERFGLVEERVS